MLSFGGLVWVPFMFSLQARFLASNHVTLQPWLVAIILVLNGKVEITMNPILDVGIYR